MNFFWEFLQYAGGVRVYIYVPLLQEDNIYLEYNSPNSVAVGTRFE